MMVASPPCETPATLRGDGATRAFATRLASSLRAGDVLLLDGPVGAGKTAFARALIQHMQETAGQPPEDVPSPTFTLVQTYLAGQLEIWHADLYRLTSPEDVAELGLIQAFEAALCLVEWPDRLGSDTPANAVTLTFAYEGPAARHITIHGAGRLAAAARDALRLTAENAP